MIRSAVSGDLPRSRILGLLLAAILLVLAFAPFLFSGAQPINTAAKICVFIVLVASYDLLLGYTGIVSFAHTMFFGIGGYGVGLALYGWGPTWTSAGLGLAIALVVGMALAFVIGLFSLRVRAIFFAMITLAVASAFAILAAQLSEFTGGEDGRSFRVPELLRPGTVLFDIPALGVSVTGRVLSYYLVFVSALAAVPGRASDRQLAVRPRAAGHPRERFPRRGARLPRRLLSHRRELPRGRDGRAGRRPQRDLAALHGARHDALVRDHARHPADGRDRRHGHDVRRGDRRDAVHRRAELPAEADGRRERGDGGAAAASRTCCTPTAGCCGSACCSS